MRPSKIRNSLKAKSAALATITQLAAATPFFLLSAYWPRIRSVLTDPSLSLELTRLLPGAIARYNIVITLAAMVMILFSYLHFRRQRRFHWHDLIIMLLLGLFFYWLTGLCALQFPICTDDTYIDFRYVYKWVNGLGFDYNPGERIMGFSSPLHLVLVSLASFLFNKHDIALTSQMLNLVLSACTYIILFQTTRRAFGSDWLALFSAVIFAANPLNLAHCIVGKEGPLVIFLMTLAIWAYTTERARLFPWITAAIAMSRPEGIIWHVVGAGCRATKGGRDEVRFWLAPTLLLLVFYASLYFYFGSLIPHGALGRATMFHAIWEPTDLACFYVLKHCGVDMFAHTFASMFAGAPDTYKIAWALQGGIAFLLIFELSREYKWLRVYAFSALLLLFFFSWFNPWVFSWYYSWFALIAPLTIPLILKTAAPLIARLKSYPSMLFMGVLCCLCSFCALIADLPPARLIFVPEHGISATLWPIFKQLRSYPFAWGESQERLLIYRRAAEYLKHQSPGTLATWEPGLLGYLLPDRKILDLGGLLSDEALKFYPVPNGERTRHIVWGSIPPESVLQLKPEWVIFFDSFADNGLMCDSGFLQQYQLDKYWPASIWGGNGLYLFKKIPS